MRYINLHFISTASRQRTVEELIAVLPVMQLQTAEGDAFC